MYRLQDPKAVREGGFGPGVKTKQGFLFVLLCSLIIPTEFQGVERGHKIFESLSGRAGF